MGAVLPGYAVKCAGVVDAREGGHEVANHHLLGLDVLKHAHVILPTGMGGRRDEQGTPGKRQGQDDAHLATLTCGLEPRENTDGQPRSVLVLTARDR